MSDKNIDKEKELLKQLEEFKNEILLNREASMGVSNYIFMDDEEVFYLIEIIEKQYKELETYKKIAEKLALLIEKGDSLYDNICINVSDGGCLNIMCKKCIIDWARKEVENELK